MRTFEETCRVLRRDLLTYGKPVNVGEVHSQKVNLPDWSTRELTNVVLEYSIPNNVEDLVAQVKPNLPWAEDHFQERVSGEPLNPPPSAAYWPFAQRGHEDHLKDGKFSHTYPERMWPKQAGTFPVTNMGIRFAYGDLDDLVYVLTNNPYTRQAYLPIWFPEDLTAARKKERVPCTLGYHFLYRNLRLNITYFIRSCDFVRFFRDDVYMACRLCQWVAATVRQHHTYLQSYGYEAWGEMGTLTMHIVSLHCFEGDVPNLRKQNATA